MYPPRRRKKANHRGLYVLIALLIFLLIGLIVLAATLGRWQDPTQPSNPSISSTTTRPTDKPTQPPTTVPPTTVPPTTIPPVVKESSFTLSAVGDMLMHSPIFNACYQSDGTYNFDSVFRYLTGHIQSADYAAGNLETTLAGLNNGYSYSGYPNFNCPDGIIDGMKNAGFDMVLTANNHSYDTRTIGMNRTLEVIADRGLTYLGTKADAEEADYLIVERNGIKLALACYTYEDNKDPNIVSPNGHTMTSEDAARINSFNYDHLDLFYDEISDSMAEADLAGADAFVLFVHWGYEYQTTQASFQSQMAQALCDLGVDVIIGGHPHVVQPVELLTSTVDETQKTVCLYSMGNAVSNQRLGNISYVKTAHTEDGVMFNVTFTRYSDGTVILESAECLPIWVNLGTNPSTGRWEYNILPLDKEITDWKTQFHLTDAALKKCNDSYDRTQAIVGAGMTQVNEYLAQNTAAVEAMLGVAS